MMRGEIFKHWQIGAATLFSAVIITGTYMLVRGVELPQLAQASAETALLQAIASRDSDSDGLPDWEESLYGTDPHVVDTFHLGMTDGAAVVKGLIVPKAVADVPMATSSPSGSGIVDPSLPPAPADGTLSASFAQEFFILFISAKQANGGADLSESQMNDIVNQALNSLSSSAKPAPDFKSIHDLTISDSGPEAFKAFAASAEMILTKNTTTATKTDIHYFNDAVMNNDVTASAHLDSISKMYRDSATGLAVIPVPKELATDDLLLINTLMHLSEIDANFAHSAADPLVAILALHQYQPTVTALGEAFTNIATLYKSFNITLPAGAPGAKFVNVDANVATKSATAQKTTPDTLFNGKQP